MSKINNHNLLFPFMFITLANTTKSKNKFVYKHNIYSHVKVCAPSLDKIYRKVPAILSFQLHQKIYLIMIKTTRIL